MVANQSNSLERLGRKMRPLKGLRSGAMTDFEGSAPWNLCSDSWDFAATNVGANFNEWYDG